MIGIVDYGMGNLGSVTNALQFLDLPARIVTSPRELAGCHAAILPGVGAFGDCMKHLSDAGFVDPLREWIAADKPFLGICLGLQLLFEGSEEAPGVAGLGVLPGRIARFNIDPKFKVPQMGWNTVRQVQPDCPLFMNIAPDAYFYFVHSYYAAAAGNFVAGETEYGLPYASAVWRGAMMAVQFHPEKSQRIGLRMIQNFADWAFERMHP